MQVKQMKKAAAWQLTWKGIQTLATFLVIFSLCKYVPSPQARNLTSSPLELPEEPVYVEPVLMNLFAFDGPLLKNSMTPARLNQVQGEALFEFFERFTEPSVECCPVDDILCRISAVAPKYIPEFLKPYLLGPQEDDVDDDNPIDFSDWVVTVCDQSIWSETTPAFLPHGATDEDSGIAFFQMTQGNSRNPDPEESDLELQHLFEDDLEVCAESDSLVDIVSRLFTFTENSRVQETVWHVQPPLAPQSNFRGYVKQANARFRELPAVRFHYHLQGTVLYEEMKQTHDFGAMCEALWTDYPALRPQSLWEQLQDDLLSKERKPHMPTLRRRSYIDLSPASGGVNPVSVAQCHAFARDPEPIDYDDKIAAGAASEINGLGFGFFGGATAKHNAMPLVDDVLHAFETVKYEYLQRFYDYADVCSTLWTDHPRTSPTAPRRKHVTQEDGSVTTWWAAEFQKNPNLAGFESLCLSLHWDRSRFFYFADPTRNPLAPKPDDPLLRLLHVD